MAITKIPLIYCKFNLELTRDEKCILASAPGIAATFEITDAKLYLLLDTLSTKDNVKLAKKMDLNVALKCSVFWSEQRSKSEIKS